ncbi:hypothetical protein [Olleya sp. Bg11-27]|uniref:hypothetical protein n=1 Tax=Olleya sp. Bg11-27 TaxID=2058135 RepID=UPI000C314918|nr:hypothetical protein [Olleya sp. Bg11-27]AUC77037.1 hypothetical protein CW732_15685 [Olleya sp. Bg11-27]
MKTQLKYLVFCLGLLVFNCKEQVAKDEATTETTKQLSDVKKMEIVKYYLLHDRKLTEADVHDIKFSGDFLDGVKITMYKEGGPFFGFPFFEALDFYNANKEQ